MASTLTADHIVAIYPDPNSITKEQAEVYLPDLVEACREYGITDKSRVAGFLGQLGEESGELVYFEELWGPTEAQLGYEGRVDLGNTESGDGYYFRGAGPIQITGRYNTTVVCDAFGLPCDPDLLRQPKDGFRAAAYFWTNMGNDYYDISNNGATDLNRFADVGDIDAMTYGVNGGLTNYENRVWYYNKAMEVLPDDLDLSEGAEPSTEPPIETDEPAEETTWLWPEAWDEPILDSWSYVDRHPTRYFWRPDVEAWARYLVDTYGVWCNTYEEHPEGYGYEVASTDEDGTVWYVQNTSLDVWAYEGRGYALDKALGDIIHSLLFNDPDLPNIDWIIWQGWMWTRAGGWSWFSDDTSDADMGHWRHIHITFE